MDLGCVKQESQSELTAHSEDHTNERSLGARSTVTFGKRSSKNLAAFESTESECPRSNMDLCDLFLSSDNNSKAMSALSDLEEDKPCESSLSSFAAFDNESSMALKNEKPKKKHRSALFGTYGRSDIVYKTILRKCRKHYLTAFNDSTNYIKAKRNRKPQFLLEKLSQFVQATFPQAEQGSDLEQELVFFLGAMFYNKHLKKCYHSNTKKKNEIDEIHSSLYKFTVQRLAFLEKYGAYNLIMKDFVTNHKDRLLEKSKTLEKAKNDFILGFGEIEKRLRQ